MDAKIFSQLITSPENQPHQYVGDSRDFENECIKAVWDMATHSLCPDTFEGFEAGIVELCERRRMPVDFIPALAASPAAQPTNEKSK